MSQAAIDAYNADADALFRKYESYDCQSYHRPLLPLLPAGGSTLLDIGAGTLRDARFLANEHGLHVTAVEPAAELVQRGIAKDNASAIEIINDSLPYLTSLGARRFDAVWSHNVLMHLPLPDVRIACQRMMDLTKPSGVILLGIRLGPPVAERHMHPLTLDDLKPMFTGTTELCCEILADHDGRPDVSFLKYAVQVP